MPTANFKELQRPLLLSSRIMQKFWAKADLARADRNHDLATAIYRLLARSELSSAEVYFFVALSKERLERPSEAVTVFESGLAKYPEVSFLFEQYVRICSEHDDIGRVVRHMRKTPDDERQVCETLLDRFPDSSVQSSLIVYCLHSGIADLAERKLDELQKNSSDNVVLWRLADILLSNQRGDDAKRIYQRLAAQPAANPLSVVHAALSAYRLGQLARAADMLEAGIQQFPHAAELVDHHALVCAQLGRMDRVIGLMFDRSCSAEQTCAALFEKFADPQIQVGLIDYCLSTGLNRIAEQRIDLIKNKSDNALALWQVSELLLSKKRTVEANAIHRKLVERATEDVEDFHLSSLAYVCLSELDHCLDRLEQGLIRYPAADKLLKLYMTICAKRFEYDRYHHFLSSLKSGQLPPPVSLLDFYRASMSAPVDFVINLQDIEMRVGERDFPVLMQDFVAYLHKNPQPIKIARVLVFFCGYLHLPSDFATGVHDALQTACVDGVKECQSLLILNEMTPPMIPRHRIQAEALVGEFIEVADRIARNALELDEPIADMTNNWTPWQYIFCLVAPKSYALAMSAFEKVVFNTWPKLQYTAPHVAAVSDDRRRGEKKLRVGFIVHDSMPMMSGFLPRLDKERFETVFLRPGEAGESIAAKSWIARAGKTVQYSDVDMYAAIQTIAAEELDIIISGPSIAAVFYPLMARLAPLQMVLLEPNWSDGLTHADYYLSWLPAEPANPSDFYKSKVAFFQHPPYWIEKPKTEKTDSITVDQRNAIRKRLLNTSLDSRIYLCANTPPKIHPDMDEFFGEILGRDKDAVLVLLRGEYPPAKSLKTRLRARLGSNYQRVVFVPTMYKNDAHMLLQSIDCCLDSFPLCGMSSSFDGAMLGIPIVTLPAEIPFGKWTAAIYDYIGVEGLTAKSPSEYVEIALELANNEQWRTRMGAEIREKSSRFVESGPSSDEFQGFLLRAWERKINGLSPTNWIQGQWQ